MMALADFSVPPESRRKALVFLRELPTDCIGRMAFDLLPAARCGLAGAFTLEALLLMGVVLSERESTR